MTLHHSLEDWSLILNQQYLPKLHSPGKNQDRGATEQRRDTVDPQGCTQKGELPLAGGAEVRVLHTISLGSQSNTFGKVTSLLSVLLVLTLAGPVYLSILGLYQFLSCVSTSQ